MVSLVAGRGPLAGKLGRVATWLAGVALIVLVRRMLLKEAVALDSQARYLPSELAEVI
jgi:hypothetical protein